MADFSLSQWSVIDVDSVNWFYAVWMWAMLLTFWRHMLPPCSVLTCIGW